MANDVVQSKSGWSLLWLALPVVAAIVLVVFVLPRPLDILLAVAFIMGCLACMAVPGWRTRLFRPFADNGPMFQFGALAASVIFMLLGVAATISDDTKVRGRDLRRPTPNVAARSAVGVATAFEPLEVVMTVEAEIDSSYRATISGNSNLPPGTKLGINLEDQITRETYGQASATVTPDGTYSSDAIGPRNGLLPGEYVARVIMPLAVVQPDDVRALIGDKGERLRGSLVERTDDGAIVEAKLPFDVGGDDARKTHLQRLKKDLVRYRNLLSGIDALFDGIEANKQHNSLSTQNDPSSTRKWVQFARSYRSEFGELQDELQSLDGRHVFPTLFLPFDDVRLLFGSVTTHDEQSYAKTKLNYLSNLQKAEQFLNDFQVELNKGK